MSRTIIAIYENGVFKPLETPDLQDHAHVRLTVEAVSDERLGEPSASGPDPLAGIRGSTGISDLAEHFDDYRFGTRRP